MKFWKNLLFSPLVRKPAFYFSLAVHPLLKPRYFFKKIDSLSPTYKTDTITKKRIAEKRLDYYFCLSLGFITIDLKYFSNFLDSYINTSFCGMDVKDELLRYSKLIRISNSLSIQFAGFPLMFRIKFFNLNIIKNFALLSPTLSGLGFHSMGKVINNKQFIPLNQEGLIDIQKKD